jgi:hypothetical protein
VENRIVQSFISQRIGVAEIVAVLFNVFQMAGASVETSGTRAARRSSGTSSSGTVVAPATSKLTSAAIQTNSRRVGEDDIAQLATPQQRRFKSNRIPAGKIKRKQKKKTKDKIIKLSMQMTFRTQQEKRHFFFPSKKTKCDKQGDN